MDVYTSKPPLTFLIPGQGSQFPGMGRMLYQEHPAFQERISKLDLKIAKLIGVSFVEMLFAPSSKSTRPFNDPRWTHPGIFAFHYCLAQTLESEGIAAQSFLGYSLGEITACTLAGMVDLEDALAIVCEVGRILATSHPTDGMMAILASDTITSDHYPLLEEVEIAGKNNPEHFVVSGKLSHMREIKAALHREGIIAEILDVGQAFHSAAMDRLEGSLAQFCRCFDFHEPLRPVISSMLGRPLRRADLQDNYFWRLHRRPVDFGATLAAWDRTQRSLFLDVSATGTLGAFTKRILGDDGKGRVHLSLDRFGNDLRNLDRLKASLLPLIGS